MNRKDKRFALLLKLPLYLWTVLFVLAALGYVIGLSLQSRGELIGVNFDRTWLSTMSDIAFDPAFCRNIALDIRYVLFVIDRIGDASYLFEEMDFAE